MHSPHGQGDPSSVAAEICEIRRAYYSRYRPGDPDGSAFLAAIQLYRERHPEIARREAAHIVSEMMRAFA